MADEIGWIYKIDMYIISWLERLILENMITFSKVSKFWVRLSSNCKLIAIVETQSEIFILLIFLFFLRQRHFIN